jgi:hypothetical protein
VAPPVAQPDGFPHGRRRVLGDALAMKSRLDHLPLEAMLSPFAGDHAFAEQQFGTSDGALLGEIVVLHHQNFADVLGMIQKHNVVPRDLVVSDVAVFAGQVLKQKDGIGRSKSPPSDPKKVALKSGRETVRALLARAILQTVLGGGHHGN